MTTYRVRFEFELSADGPRAAAQHAFEQCTAPDGLLPIAEVAEGPAYDWANSDVIDVEEEVV